MKKLLLVFALFLALAVPAQASWWSVTNTYVYGSVTWAPGCDTEGTWTVLFYGETPDLVATGTVNPFGNYTTSSFYLAGVWNDSIVDISGKNGSGVTRHTTIIGGGGNEIDVHIDICN